MKQTKTLAQVAMSTKNINTENRNAAASPAASKNTRKALCDELCTLLGYKTWEIRKDACTGDWAGCYDYSLKFGDGKKLYICTRADMFDRNVKEMIDSFKRTSKEGIKAGDYVEIKGSGRVAKVVSVGTEIDDNSSLLYLYDEQGSKPDPRYVEIYNTICSSANVRKITAETEAEGIKAGDKVRHNILEEVATVTAIRKAFVSRADGYRYLYTLDFGKSVLGPFQVDLNKCEFLREAFTLL